MTRWLALVYKLPPKPSAPRVAVWRALKKLSGAYLVDGLYVVEERREARLALENLVHDVQNYGGEAFLLEVAGVDDEAALTRKVRESRRAS